MCASTVLVDVRSATMLVASHTTFWILSQLPARLMYDANAHWHTHQCSTGQRRGHCRMASGRDHPAPSDLTEVAAGIARHVDADVVRSGIVIKIDALAVAGEAGERHAIAGAACRQDAQKQKHSTSARSMAVQPPRMARNAWQAVAFAYAAARCQAHSCTWRPARTTGRRRRPAAEDEDEENSTHYLLFLVLTATVWWKCTDFPRRAPSLVLPTSLLCVPPTSLKNRKTHNYGSIGHTRQHISPRNKGWLKGAPGAHAVASPAWNRGQHLGARHRRVEFRAPTCTTRHGRPGWPRASTKWEMLRSLASSPARSADAGTDASPATG